MKKRPKMILAAVGVLASAAFYVLSGEGKPTDKVRIFPEEETETFLSEEETFSEKQIEEIRVIVTECLTESLKEDVSTTVRDVLSARVEEMAESGRLSEALDICAEKEAGLINVNRAGKEELKTLPGIGDVKAESILSFREENGPFSSVEDLVLVDGISPSLLEKIRPNITV